MGPQIEPVKFNNQSKSVIVNANNTAAYIFNNLGVFNSNATTPYNDTASAEAWMIPYVNDSDPHKAKTICAYKPNLANRIIVFAVIPLSSKARTARSLSAYTLSMMILKAERERERERERGRGTMEKDKREIL